jgi:hypothetical protein
VTKALAPPVEDPEPWYKSPWIWASALAITAGGAYGVWRWSRR